MKDWLRDLCEKIHMPQEVSDYLLVQEQAGSVAEDPKMGAGLAELALRLKESESTFGMYEEKGMPARIFYDTMECFSRFVKEYKEAYGTYGFDRDFWVSRQLTGRLFRIGELEYEMCREQDEDVLSVHIPSDAGLAQEKCRVSYLAAKDFFTRYYPEYPADVYICESWLLSPVLQAFLPPTSNIIRFQQAFWVEQYHESSEEYKRWVFKNAELATDQLPEDTSLQRAIKAHLQKGGKVGEALGRLKDGFLV